MQEFKIPKEFTIFGERHKVKFVKSIDRGKTYGEWDPNKNIIRLEKSLSLTPDKMEQTFIHELIHCCLDHLSYIELNKDEKFVDDLSKALHQAFKTFKY